MGESRDSDVSANAEIIDEVLQHLPAVASRIGAVAMGPVPQPPNLRAMAQDLGLEVKRGAVGPDFKGIAIPEFYSEREARLTIARRVARIALERVGNECSVVDGEHVCPEPQVCDFVESAKTNNNLIDTVAAAVLMPTDDFLRWANHFGNAEQPLSDSYAVPRALARIRLRTLKPAEASPQP